MRMAISCFGLLILILLLASFPIVIDISSGNLVIQFHQIWELIFNYFNGLLDGKSFLYQVGKERNPNFLQDVPSFFIISLFYLLVTGLIAIIIGLLVSAWHSRSKHEWMKDIIGFLGMIPDFILVLFLQLGAVFFYQTTGYRLARIATRGVDEHAVLLPLITLTIIPTIYLIRTLSEHTYDVLAEDYILTAKAKGITKTKIFIRHVVRNVLPFLKGDLHKVIAMMMSNLFIVEYLFNISGLTKLLFGGGMVYQFNLTVNTLVAFVLLYLILYIIIRLFIFCLERIFAHD